MITVFFLDGRFIGVLALIKQNTVVVMNEISICKTRSDLILGSIFLESFRALVLVKVFLGLGKTSWNVKGNSDWL